MRKQDVLAFIDAAPPPPLHIESPYKPEPAQPAAAAVPGGQLSRMRRQIGEHMKRSLDTAAHCTTWIEVDMSRVEAARARLGVTALPLVARATIAALREHPALNAWLEGESYTRHRDVHLGIAVSLGEDGLIVPVVHGAHELSVEGLANRIKDLARRARAGELSPDDVRGGTFTITNPGQYGSIMATPIINQPQVAILDLEAVTKHPVVVTDADGNDSIAIRPMTILGLSWDHRALDGAQVAQFLATREAPPRAMERAVKPELWVCHLGTVDYRKGLDLQERIRIARQQDELPDVLLMLEHRPVYTRGRRSAVGELPMGEDWYALQGIEIGRDRPRRQGHLPRPGPARRLSDRPRRRRARVRPHARARPGRGPRRSRACRPAAAPTTAATSPASGSASGRSPRSASTSRAA